MQVNSNTAIAEVKKILHTKTGYPPNRQRLIYAGKNVQDERTLWDYGIQKGSTLDVILRGRLDSQESITAREKSFSSKKEVTATIEAWKSKAKAGDFDDDLYLVDPQAYYHKLQYLEQDVVETSEFFRCKGRYDPSNNQAPDLGVRLKFMSVPDWAWTLDEISLSSSSATASLDDYEAEWQDVQNTLASLWKSYLIICRVLANLDDMKKAEFCDDFFNVLVENPKEELAEIVRIPVTDVDDIRGSLEIAIPQILGQFELKAWKPYLFDYLVGPCSRMLKRLDCPCDLSLTMSTSSIAMLCRMTALMLDLSLNSYMGSHGCRFDLDYIGQDCHDIGVQSSSNDVFSFSFRLRRLACLDRFLDKRMAWCFLLYAKPRVSGSAERAGITKPLSILTRMRDFADIWGPIGTVWVREGVSEMVRQYNVSKGVICRVKDEPLSYRGAIRCHWFDWSGFRRRRLFNIFSRPEDLYLSNDDLLLIGAVYRENLTCAYTLDNFESDYENSLEVLGTCPAKWKLDSRGGSVSVANIFGITFSGTQKRIPETSLKQHIYNRWTARPDSFRANPAILNHFLAVEVSHCTGNARRVTLGDVLLMESVEPLLEHQIPQWKAQPWGRKFHEALQSDDTQAIFDFWDRFKTDRKYVAELLCSVLEVLHTTGCRDGAFVTGLFNCGQESSVKLDLKRNDWACFLRDSPYMAVYAVINRVCLECQTPNHCTATHGSSESRTVLQTQIALEKKTHFKRVKLDPHGYTFKKFDGGAPEITLLVPESSLERIMSITTSLNHSLVTAAELRIRKMYTNPRSHAYFCASNKSHGGMETPRIHAVSEDLVLEPTQSHSLLAPENNALRRTRNQLQLSIDDLMTLQSSDGQLETQFTSPRQSRQPVPVWAPERESSQPLSSLATPQSTEPLQAYGEQPQTHQRPIRPCLDPFTLSPTQTSRDQNNHSQLSPISSEIIEDFGAYGIGYDWMQGWSEPYWHSQK